MELELALELALPLLSQLGQTSRTGAVTDTQALRHSAVPAVSRLQSVDPGRLQLVEIAGLVVVWTLRAAETGDDGGHQQEGGDHHHGGDDQGDAAGLHQLVQDQVLLGAAVFVYLVATAEHIIVGGAMAGTEESLVPDPQNIRVSATVLRPHQSCK